MVNVTHKRDALATVTMPYQPTIIAEVAPTFVSPAFDTITVDEGTEASNSG